MFRLSIAGPRRPARMAWPPKLHVRTNAAPAPVGSGSAHHSIAEEFPGEARAIGSTDERHATSCACPVSWRC